MSKLARLGAVGACLALAPVLLFQGMANASNPGGPWISSNGFTMASLARTGMGVRQRNGVTTLSVDRRSLDMARRAFVREPLASDALFLLAVDERAAGGNAGDQPLLDAAVAHDKRNRLLNTMRVEQAVRRRDFAGTSAALDRMARVDPESAVEFVQPLVQALGDEQVLPMVRNILGRNPAWAPSFWEAVPNDPRLVGRMFQLRQMTDRGATAESDAKLMEALVTTGRFEDAFAFRDSALARPVAGTGFVAAGGTAPFAWETTARGELSMTPKGGEGYALFVQRGFSGEMARQVLRLAPGTYTFGAQVTPASQAHNFTVRMECAGEPGPRLDAQPLGNPVRFTLPASCRYWWLVLEGSAWQAPSGVRAEIADMRFDRQP